MFDSVFPKDVAFACIRQRAKTSPKLGAFRQSSLKQNKSIKRIKEFSLGRLAAQLALKKLGIKNTTIIAKGASGEPLWPKGTVGSITHSANFAICVVARKSKLSAVGIDLEQRKRFKDAKIAKRVCLAEEALWIQASSRHATLRTAMMFSAKEAIYKALFPLYGKYFGFKKVRLKWDDESSRFCAELLFDVNRKFRQGFCFPVDCLFRRGFVFAYVLL